jgi:photosystem II stability/assembly factor-like uncharacterized protein
MKITFPRSIIVFLFLSTLFFTPLFFFVGNIHAQTCTLKSQGDANCDGKVDLIDFEQWRREFTGLATTRLGDFNGDSKTDLIDFELWRRTFAGGITNPTATPTTGGSGAYVWKPISIGGGGYVSGIDMSDDGATRMIRTDIGGAYRWDGSSKWIQMISADSMPAEDRVPGTGGGIFDLAISHSQASRAYMLFAGRAYRSDDGGAHWKRTAYAGHIMDSNDTCRAWDHFMAVDPQNPDVVVMAGSVNGTMMTTDGGNTWQRLNGIAQGALDTCNVFNFGQHGPGYAGIAFDKSSGLINGRTKTIYVNSIGHGVFISNDGGTSWSSSSGSPASVDGSDIGPDGTYYAIGTSNTQCSNSFGSTKVMKYKAGVWADITPPNWQGICTGLENPDVTVDIHNPAHIVVGSEKPDIYSTFDAGKTWSTFNLNSSASFFSGGDTQWVENYNKSNLYLVLGGMKLDPVVANRLWISFGHGVAYTDIPPTAANSLTWSSITHGIENMVGTSVVVPSNNHPIIGVEDFGNFTIQNPDQFTAAKGPNNTFKGTWGMSMSPFNHSYVVSATSDGFTDRQESAYGAYSSDGGATWNKFPTQPSGAQTSGQFGFGSIAVSSPGNIVWVPAAPGTVRDPYYTRDGGQSWNKITLPGMNGDYDYLYPYFLNIRQNVTADGATQGTFYIYHAHKGIYKSTDGGATWQLLATDPGMIGDIGYYGVKLAAMPGKAGNLFFSTGASTNGFVGIGPEVLKTDVPFWHSTDGATTWTKVPNVTTVVKFGYGAPSAGSTTQTVYILGYVNQQFGLYRSTDNGTSWQKISDFPLYMMGVTDMAGDPDQFGKLYVVFGGYSAAYGYPGP